MIATHAEDPWIDGRVPVIFFTEPHANDTGTESWQVRHGLDG